ncbi:hypothetical protein JXM83_06570 [Candidatus Woesearchaeota archaeon]|nr:hypothetical protein [Candidatus Woesearchaeota archaeon]
MNCNSKSKCSKHENHAKKITLFVDRKANSKTKYYLENDKNLIINSCEFDSCPERSSENEERCDRIIYTNTNHIILLELKGRDEKKALSQIVNTYGLIKENLSPKSIIYGIVVTKPRSPKLKVSREHTDAKKLFKTNLHCLKCDGVQNRQKISIFE